MQLSKLIGIRDFALTQKDVDLQEHMDNLSKKHLKEAEWQLEPL